MTGQGSPSGADPQQPLYAQNSQLASVDAVDLLRNNGNVPGLTTAPEGTLSQSGDFYVNGSGSETLISVPKPSAAAVPDVAPAGRAVSAPAARTASAAPQAASNPAPKPAAQANNQTKSAAQTKAHNDFWVQTGAFSTLARAEGVKETLSSKGITSIIENRDVDGKTLFRVRIGPYTSQNEANYWLSLIKSISGFEDSQVRQTTRL